MKFKFSLKRILPVLTGCILLTACHSGNYQENDTQWQVYGGSKRNIRYSALRQVDTGNVKQLQVAWVYHTDDADTAAHSQIQCNPIVVNNVLYATTPKLRLFALNAATGKAKWVFNPAAENQNHNAAGFGMNNNRGVTYWQDGQDQRIFYCAGNDLYAVNAATGKPVTTFGQGGRVDLHTGLGSRAAQAYVAGTTPGIIYKDLYILGCRVNETADAAPGSIRAFDVRTGKLRWVFHTIPQPHEAGYDTWKDKQAWQHIGSANSWAGFSLDESRGLLFAPTGSAAFDFYGGRRKGAGLYANCLLALNAATGRLKWHYQVIHHDVWDKDLPTAPALVTVQHNGKPVDAVAQPTKHGFIFVLDRETGKPLFPIAETLVDTHSELSGEELWPTQPIPRLPQPFTRQQVTDKDLNPYLTAADKAEVLQKLHSYRHGSMFIPPGKQSSVIFPGFDGGAEWGGPAYDPATGLLYLNANEMAWVLTMIDAPKPAAAVENVAQAGTRLFMSNCVGCHGADRKGSGNYPSLLNIGAKYHYPQLMQLLASGRRMMPSFRQLSVPERRAIVAYLTGNKNAAARRFTAPMAKADTFLNLPYQMDGYHKFLSPSGEPAIAPPWGTLNAINLNTGKLAWRIPLGNDSRYAQKTRENTGTENYGGPAVTAGGLLFIAATKDGKLRAFNKANGRLLWETPLPAPGFATPAVYQVNNRQYIVIACGGGKLGTPSGDAYIAYALPGR